MLGRSLFVVASAAAAVLIATPGAGANPADSAATPHPTNSATATATWAASTPSPFRRTPSAKPTPRPAPDLAAIGATVRAVGVAQVKIRVGVKNVSSVPVVLQPDAATDHPVIAYIHLPGNTFGLRAPERCAGWGPTEEGWEWADPGLASPMYACLGVTVQPGQTDWIEITLKVYPDRKATRGFIQVGSGAPDAVSANDEAAITVLTKAAPPASGGGAGLPVTGMPLGALVTVGGVLILLGAVALASAQRRRIGTRPGPSPTPPSR